MNEEQEELYGTVQCKIGDEGLHNCFASYSDWEDIKDEEFHRLRLNYLQSAKQLEDYIDDKNKE